MPLVKASIGCALVALVLSACGTSAKPAAGTIPPTATAAGHALVDDPRAKHLPCLRQQKIPFTEVGRTDIQIGTAPSGPTVSFTATPGSAQAVQIDGQDQGAEVIGSALLYPNQAPDNLLSAVEACLSQGVKG